MIAPPPGTRRGALTAPALALLLAAVSLARSEEIAPPRVSDPRLEIRLFAADPDIVTPVGIDLDGEGRVHVIESHTHSPPKDYPGPESDRIKVLLDRDGDGRAEDVRVFADGLEDAMNIAFSPGGVLHVCQRTSVVALHDRDGDGRSESRRVILELDTRQSYDHSSMLGIAFSPDGWLYASRGNIAGYPYTIRSADGSELSGYGDGGNIVRSRPDGSGLEEVATGFWNPFALELDAAGRLLAADNDPDARGPNRVVHVIRGGDYGFRALYGPSGLHPYDAWDGELPGTLPGVAGVGEAPAGVLDGDRAAFPEGYAGNLLVTVWGEHTVERLRPRRHGVSIRADHGREVLVEGGSDFRPVGIAAAPDGTVYITDWVKRLYPNHGKGRVWRLRARDDAPAPRAPRPRFGRPRPDPGARRLEQLLETRDAERAPELLAALGEDDPFVRSAAVSALARPAFREVALEALDDAVPRARLGALLALRRAGIDAPRKVIEKRLADPSPEVRTVALMWAGEERIGSLRPSLEKAVEGKGVSADLLEIYLATVQLVSGDDADDVARRTPGFRIRRSRPVAVIETILHDESRSPSLRELALRLLPLPPSPRTFDLVAKLARSEASPLRGEAVRTLGLSASPEAGPLLLEIARDRDAPLDLRSDAVAGLSRRPPGVVRGATALLEDPEPRVRLEAARALRAASIDADVRDALRRRSSSLRSASPEASAGGDAALDRALAEEIDLALGNEAEGEGDNASLGPSRPASDAGWRALLEDGGGDPRAGRRVFYHPAASCSRCHAIGGRGGMIGPDLSNIARSLDRAQLIESLLEPSAKVAPEFQAYTVVMEDGRILSGLQFHYRGTRHATLLLENGEEVRFQLADVLEHERSELSLMPDGLEEALSVGALRDLVAYLETLR